MKTYQITIRPLPSDVPEVVRLRHALKMLLRAHKLRAVDVREVTDDEDRDNRTGSEQDKRSDVAPMETPEPATNAPASQPEALAGILLKEPDSSPSAEDNRPVSDGIAPEYDVSACPTRGWVLSGTATHCGERRGASHINPKSTILPDQKDLTR